MFKQHHKKAQILIANVIILFMFGVIMFFSWNFLADILENFTKNLSLELRLVTSLILPLMIVCFVIVVLKVLRQGEGG